MSQLILELERPLWQLGFQQLFPFIQQISISILMFEVVLGQVFGPHFPF